MLLKGLNAVANIMFLLVSIAFFMVIMTNDNSEASGKQAASEVRKIVEGNFRYLEKRVNAVQGSLDNYQITVNHRIDVLEYKIKALESENKALKIQNKNNIHNSNTNTISVNNNKE